MGAAKLELAEGFRRLPSTSAICSRKIMVSLATSAELLLRQKTMALSRFFFMLTKASLWKWKSFGSTFRSHSRNRGLKSAGPSTLSINFSGLLICRQIGKVRPRYSIRRNSFSGS